MKRNQKASNKTVTAKWNAIFINMFTGNAQLLLLANTAEQFYRSRVLIVIRGRLK